MFSQKRKLKSIQVFPSYRLLYSVTVGDLPQGISASRDAIGHLSHLTVEVTLNLKRKLHKVYFMHALKENVRTITARQ